MNFKGLLNSEKYGFLRTHERLGKRIVLLGLGGSHAYGTSNDNSDVDFRGITLNMPSDLLGLTEFEQYEDDGTDTVIYAFNKIIKLLLECNPNTCEILGLDENQYLIKTSWCSQKKEKVISTGVKNRHFGVKNAKTDNWMLSLKHEGISLA